MKSVLWLGFGDIAQRTATLFPKSVQVSGVKRSPMTASEHVSMLYGDISSATFLKSTLQSVKPDVIVITLTPSEFSEEGYQTSYIQPVKTLTQALLEVGIAPRVLFVSSTSVYAQSYGHWVNEESETAPSGFSGRTMLECEALLANYPGQSTVVRASGIYGPGRTRLLDNLREGRIALNDNWTNRIHSDDLAGVIIHLLNAQQKLNHDVVIATDNEPSIQSEVYTWLAELLNIEISKTSERNTPVRGANKRLSNQKLVATGFEFRYSSYKDGYKALLD
ncbi:MULTISPECIES: NAD-dependent epimerase/dehydratase family protein [Gammaproteobacteria]|uniref:NAD-dependent epimerase/dehydratase family protein n=1 Tax=Gammaproteobacteria TaxID=1236 RepID=UPI000DD0750B|nr:MULTISPECIES: NAD-dependent epimerase/dehydratase family protein [Gammaproteobacteria]RTE87768.1 NAD-dependent epimerase/dehydratase family protein [Aliidiomarina sp. B3213]TCZ92449.1 NAD-dependent epimerase/dehydratase family protein [Lysobacter sp. N42]